MVTTKKSRSCVHYLSIAIATVLTSGCSGGASGVPGPISQTIPASSGLFQAASSETMSTSGSDAYEKAVAADRPLAYYPLGDAGSTLTDASGNGYNGSYGSHISHGAEAVRGSAPSSAFPGGAYSANDFATVAAKSALEPVNELSAEAWIRAAANNSTNGYISLVSYGREIQGQSYALQVSPANRFHVFLTTSTGPKFLDSKAVITAGKPYYVAISFNGQTLSLYVNGVLDSSTSFSGSLRYSSSDGLAIGGAQGGRWNTFQGTISDVAIYGSVLSASDVSGHFAAATAAQATSTPDPTPSVAPSSLPNPASGQYDETVSGDKAIAFYKMNAETSTLSDSIGHNSGQFGSGVTHSGKPLTSDGGIGAVFQGSSSSNAIVSDASGLHPTTGVSVEAWIELPSMSSTTEPILAYGTESFGSQAYGMYIGSGVVDFQVHPQNGGMTVYSPTLQPNVPYHLVGTYDGTNVELYVNGQLVQRKTTQGQFSYHSNGFAIGSSVSGSMANFNGTIAGVSIYKYALSASQIENHFVEGFYAPMTTEMPSEAETFVNSVGVNTHFEESDYGGADYAKVSTLLEASGIKHIREGTVENGTYQQELNDLASHGIKSTIETMLNESDQMIEQFPATIANSIEAYEGPNEPNYDGADWPSETISTMQRLHTDVKNTPSLQHLPILAPALSGGFASLGSVSSYVDYGNMHDYFSTYNPGTGGWGSPTPYGVYGSLAYNMNLAATESGAHPIISTETGYGSGTAEAGSSSTVDLGTAAKYIPRTYFVHFNAGVPRTFIYEFLDQNLTGQPFTNNGFLDVNLNPKPSYNALKAILADLTDSTSAFTPTPLTYRLSGNLANVNHTLLQKADGSYYIALWLEVVSYKDGPINVPSQTVTITTAKPMTAASVMRIDANGNEGSSSLISAPSTTVSLPVTDQISILKVVI